MGQLNNIPALVQIKTWRHEGDKSLSEPMMISLPKRICVIRPEWVKKHWITTISFIWCTLLKLLSEVIVYILPICGIW